MFYPIANVLLLLYTYQKRLCSQVLRKVKNGLYRYELVRREGGYARRVGPYAYGDDHAIRARRVCDGDDSNDDRCQA